MAPSGNTFKLLALGAVLLTACLFSLTNGPSNLGLSDLLMGNGSEILLKIRIPKVITAILAGGGLAVAGQVMQAMFRNPLAGPDILGVSSGAGLAVAMGTLAGIPLGLAANTSLAMLGAFATLMLLLSVSNRFTDLSSILILGVVLASLSGSITTILSHYAQSTDLQRYTFWTHGSLGGVTLEDLPLLLVLVILFMAILFYFAKSLDAIRLGEEQAKSVGVDVRRLKWVSLVITAGLSGVVTAYCGPISFVGIAVPYLSNILLRTPYHRSLLVGSFLAGALFLVLADIISGLFPQQLPINAMTALLGAPVVLKAMMSYTKPSQ